MESNNRDFVIKTNERTRATNRKNISSVGERLTSTNKSTEQKEERRCGERIIKSTRQ